MTHLPKPINCADAAKIDSTEAIHTTTTIPLFLGLVPMATVIWTPPWEIFPSPYGGEGECTLVGDYTYKLKVNTAIIEGNK